MEQDNSKVAWGKALKPIFALLLVIVLWQVLVLEMLKNGIISTLIAVVLVSAVSVVIFGIVFWVVKSLLNQFLTIAQGKTEDDQIPSAGSAMQFQNFLLNADISSIPDKHVPGASLRGCKY